MCWCHSLCLCLFLAVFASRDAACFFACLSQGWSREILGAGKLCISVFGGVFIVWRLAKLLKSLKLQLGQHKDSHGLPLRSVDSLRTSTRTMFNSFEYFTCLSTIFLSSLLDHYGSIWSGGVSSSYSYNANPNNMSTASTLYQPGQSCITTNNISNPLEIIAYLQLLYLTILNLLLHHTFAKGGCMFSLQKKLFSILPIQWM